MQTSITSPATLSGLCLEDYAPVEALSEETTAFSATVYDVEAGAPIGTLANDGHGGCHRFRPDSLEGQKRWDAACREFTPVPWSGGEYAGRGEWELDEALTLLSESALTLLNECEETETKFFAADPRSVVDSETLTVVTSTHRRGKISATALFRLAADCHDDYGPLVFGAWSASGGVNVFVTETIDIDGERMSSRAGEESGVR